MNRHTQHIAIVVMVGAAVVGCGDTDTTIEEESDVTAMTIKINADDIDSLPAGKHLVIDLGATGTLYVFDDETRPIDLARVDVIDQDGVHLSMPEWMLVQKDLGIDLDPFLGHVFAIGSGTTNATMQIQNVYVPAGSMACLDTGYTAGPIEAWFSATPKGKLMIRKKSTLGSSWVKLYESPWLLTQDHDFGRLTASAYGQVCGKAPSGQPATVSITFSTP